MQPLLKVEKLVKGYESNNVAGAREKLLALDGVSFAIARGNYACGCSGNRVLGRAP